MKFTIRWPIDENGYVHFGDGEIMKADAFKKALEEMQPVRLSHEEFDRLAELAARLMMSDDDLKWTQEA